MHPCRIVSLSVATVYALPRSEGLKSLGLIGLFLTAFEDGLYTDFSFFLYVTLPSIVVGVLAPAFSMAFGELLCLPPWHLTLRGPRRILEWLAWLTKREAFLVGHSHLVAHARLRLPR